MRNTYQGTLSNGTLVKRFYCPRRGGADQIMETQTTPSGKQTMKLRDARTEEVLAYHGNPKKGSKAYDAALKEAGILV